MTPDSHAIDEFNEQMMANAEVLIVWLSKQFKYDVASIFFLCAVVQGMIHTSWPTEKGRPETFTNLLDVINELGAEIGPILAAIEVIEQDETSQSLH